MASPFKIPKRSSVCSTQEGPDCVLMQSPLERLQGRASASEKRWAESSADCQDTMHSGMGFRGGKSSCSLKPLFRDTVKSLLGIQQPAGGRGPTPTPPPHPPSHLSNRRWRPRRASDRLSETLPTQKKSSGSSGGLLLLYNRSDRFTGSRGVSVEPSGPSSPSSDTSRTPGPPDTGVGVQNQAMESSSSSDSAGPTSDGVLSPSPHCPSSRPLKVWKPSPSAGSLSGSETPNTSSGPGKAESRLSLNRTSWLAASSHLQRQRDEEGEIDRRSLIPRTLTLGSRTRRDHATSSEPIVLSSEEEDGEHEEDVRPSPGEQAGGPDLSGLRPGPGSGPRSDPGPDPESGLRGGASTADQTASPAMQLDFTDLHLGLTRTPANGTLTISEHCITLPLKDAEGGGQCEVVVVATEVRGHGLWDGCVAGGGGPAPSLLFLWVTNAQAKLLQTELSHIHPVTEPGSSCVFMLIVLSVSDLQAALCRSMLDTEQYCTSSSSSLDLSQAVHLLGALPPLLHTHLLLLLGQPKEPSNQLIQYPAPPSRGRITVTTEDLACLQQGHFLNDVIIDFYLKYLLLEKVDAVFSERCHVFSSFFFKQLSRRRGEDPTPLNRETRHQRVKTWTRHIDIFTKDFLFVPVNQEAHWYLLVICFPGLEGVQFENWARPSGAADKSKTKSSFTLRPPECSQAGCERGSVLKRSCILVMDSLQLSSHENACRLLRDYLQVEWQVKRGRPRPFTPHSVRSAVCRLPLQDNSSDCGLYLLQYAESFLQNPVVHFDLPVRLEGWFPRQQVRSKRDQIRSLVLDLQEDQNRDQAGTKLVETRTDQASRDHTRRDQ